MERKKYEKICVKIYAREFEGFHDYKFNKK